MTRIHERFKGCGAGAPAEREGGLMTEPHRSGKRRGVAAFAFEGDLANVGAREVTQASAGGPQTHKHSRGGVRARPE